jgi:hypothetical protein
MSTGATTWQQKNVHSRDVQEILLQFLVLEICNRNPRYVIRAMSAKKMLDALQDMVNK